MHYASIIYYNENQSFKKFEQFLKSYSSISIPILIINNSNKKIDSDKYNVNIIEIINNSFYLGIAESFNQGIKILNNIDNFDFVYCFNANKSIVLNNNWQNEELNNEIAIFGNKERIFLNKDLEIVKLFKKCKNLSWIDKYIDKERTLPYIQNGIFVVNINKFIDIGPFINDDNNFLKEYSFRVLSVNENIDNLNFIYSSETDYYRKSVYKQILKNEYELYCPIELNSIRQKILN